MDGLQESSVRKEDCVVLTREMNEEEIGMFKDVKLGLFGD